MIEKTYFYGAGEAGVETIVSLDDFILYHIQDEEVGISEAMRLAKYEVIQNGNLDEDVVEIYRCLNDSDIEELKAQINKWETEQA